MAYQPREPVRPRVCRVIGWWCPPPCEEDLAWENMDIQWNFVVNCGIALQPTGITQLFFFGVKSCSCFTPIPVIVDMLVDRGDSRRSPSNATAEVPETWRALLRNRRNAWASGSPLPDWVASPVTRTQAFRPSGTICMVNCTSFCNSTLSSLAPAQLTPAAGRCGASANSARTEAVGTGPPPDRDRISRILSGRSSVSGSRVGSR